MALPVKHRPKKKKLLRAVGIEPHDFQIMDQTLYH